MDKSIVLKIFGDLVKVDRIRYPKAKVLTVAHDNDRSLSHKGRWYSPLIDTIEDDLRARDVTCVSVARIISRIKGEIAYGNVFSPEGAFARALLAKRLAGVLNKGTYPYSNMEEAVWGDILDQTGAEKAVGIQPSREMCVACHKRGVWVADVQHGVIGESHPWYGTRFRSDDPPEWLPDAFIVWDAGSAAVIDPWAEKKGIRTIVTGNRWVARFLSRQPGDQLVNELFSRYEENQVTTGPDRKATVLITLSWGNNDIPNGFLPDAMCEVIRATAGQYSWLVRLHPNQLSGFATHEGGLFREFFENNLKGHVEWESATRSALPVVLRYSDAHISWNSSVSIEAAQMGVRTALLDPGLRDPQKRGDYYEYYRNKGMIDFVEPGFDDIIQWLDTNVSSKRAPEHFGPYDEAYNGLLQFLVK